MLPCLATKDPADLRMPYHHIRNFAIPPHGQSLMLKLLQTDWRESRLALLFTALLMLLPADPTRNLFLAPDTLIHESARSVRRSLCAARGR